jgi:peptide/nickel transport system ATP-binding protein
MAGSGKAHLRDGSLLRVEDLVVEFPAGPGRKVHAVSGISLDVVEGETLGLVGESGCGKSTTGKAIMQMPRPTSGTVAFEGEALTSLKGEALRQTRPTMQMIFQDPISSLNPRRKVGDIIGEPCGCGVAATTPSARRRSARCSRPSASTPTPPCPGAPTSSPGGSASASRSPGPSCSTRG